MMVTDNSTVFSPEDINGILLNVFRLAVLGGLETNPAPCNAETVANLFDYLVDVARAARTESTSQRNNTTNNVNREEVKND